MLLQFFSNGIVNFDSIFKIVNIPIGFKNVLQNSIMHPIDINQNYGKIFASEKMRPGLQILCLQFTNYNLIYIVKPDCFFLLIFANICFWVAVTTFLTYLLIKASVCATGHWFASHKIVVLINALWYHHFEGATPSEGSMNRPK